MTRATMLSRLDSIANKASFVEPALISVPRGLGLLAVGAALATPVLKAVKAVKVVKAVRAHTDVADAAVSSSGFLISISLSVSRFLEHVLSSRVVVRRL